MLYHHCDINKDVKRDMDKICFVNVNISIANLQCKIIKWNLTPCNLFFWSKPYLSKFCYLIYEEMCMSIKYYDRESSL